MENNSNFDLASFKKAQQAMVATNDNAYESSEMMRQRVARVRDYSESEIKQIINSGSLIAQRQLSRNYFYKDGFYKRIICYYATLLKYAGILIPNPVFGKSLSETALQKRYNNALDFVERAKLPEILTSISQKALVDGCYYGILMSFNKKSLTIMDLPGKYCCSRFKDENGNAIIEFDVTYFNTITNETLRKKALNNYPKVVQKAYKQYMSKGRNSKWAIIPSDLGICFSLFDERPMFLNLIPATINYDIAVATERERDLEEIRKILVQKIPHLNDGTLLFEPDEAQVMHEGAVGMTKKNPNISVLTTYADVDAIVSKTQADTVSNNLDKASQNIYSQGGVSAELFAATGSSSLGTSIQNDVSLMMVLGNKYSNFITSIVNKLYSNTTISFKFTILPISFYNESDYLEDAFKLAQSGYSLLMPVLAQGLTQRDLGNLKSLENDMLKLPEKLIPPQSSYTQSAQSSSEGGRPTKDVEDKTEKTIEKDKSIEKN